MSYYAQTAVKKSNNNQPPCELNHKKKNFPTNEEVEHYTIIMYLDDCNPENSFVSSSHVVDTVLLTSSERDEIYKLFFVV